MANPYDQFDSAELSAFRQSAVSGVGAIPKGAAILASRVAEQPVVDEFGRPVDPSQMAKKPLSSVERMERVKADPVYKAGEELQQGAKEAYPVPAEKEKDWGIKFSRMAGSFLPLLGSGPLAPATIGLQSIGDRMGEAYEAQIEKGKTPEEAAAAAEKQALASGALQATLFKFIPEPLKKLADKTIVDRMSKGLVSEFFANRASQAVEGGIQGALSTAGENVIAGKPILTDTGESTAAMAALQTLMPRGASATKSEKPLSRRVEEKPAPSQPVPEAEPTAGMLSGERSVPAATTLTINGIEYTKTDKGWVTPEGVPMGPEASRELSFEKGSEVEPKITTIEQPASEIVPPPEKQTFGGVEYTKTEKGWIDPEGNPIDPSVEELLPSAKALEDPKLLENPEAWANKVIEERKGQVSANIDPELATAYVIKGSLIISRGVKDFAAWSNEMVKEFGDSIKTHLDVLWTEANKASEGRPVMAEKPAEVLPVAEQPISDILASEPLKAPLATEVAVKPEPVKERQDLPATSALNILYSREPALPIEGKRTNAEVAQQLQEAAIKNWGGEPVTSTTITPQQESAIVNNAFEEVLAGLKQEGHAADWYTTAVKKALAVARVIHPELVNDAAAQKSGFADAKTAELGLATALAITSQNLNVTQNTKYANEQFKILKETGRFDPSYQYGTKAESISANLKLANKLLDLNGWEGFNTLVNQEFTVGELSELAKKITGKKTTIAGRVNDVVNGSSLFGPKIGGGFLQNLLGNFNPVTVDLWMRRTWGRWTGDVLPEPVSAPQIARLIEGLKEQKLPVPEVLKGVRTIPTGGKKGPTLSEKSAERLLSNPESVSGIYKAAEELDTRWNKVFDHVRNPLTPEQAAAVRDGSLSLEGLNKQLEKPLKDREAAWVKFKDSSEVTLSKEARKEFYQAYDAQKGRTQKLTNEEISNGKPTWAKAARVISNILKPIDAPTDQDREVINRIVNTVRGQLEQRGLKTTNADIQAILWYPEKDIWSKLSGDTESRLKNSYDEEFLKLARSQGLGDQADAALQAFNEQGATPAP